MENPERETQGSVRADAGRRFIPLQRGGRHRVHRTAVLYQKSDRPSCDLLRVQRETDNQRVLTTKTSETMKAKVVIAQATVDTAGHLYELARKMLRETPIKSYPSVDFRAVFFPVDKYDLGFV